MIADAFVDLSGGLADHLGVLDDDEDADLEDILA